MEDFDKNTEKNFLRQLFSDLDGLWIVLSRSLIVLTIIPLVIAGFVAIKNYSYKNEIINLKDSIKLKNSIISKQNDDINLFNNQIMSMKYDLTNYQQKTSEITAKYNALSKKKRIEDNDILKDIQQIKKNIFKLNRQIILVEKRLNPQRQAKRD